jgi:hypothetical protein
MDHNLLTTQRLKRMRLRKRLPRGSVMGYHFAGFFLKPPTEQPADLPDGAVWRPIEVPFVGSGVLLPDLLGKSPAPSDVKHLACGLGLNATADWIFIDYSCWAGRIDFVYGFGARAGTPFGPMEESAPHENESVYVRLMGEFGVSPGAAVNFTPFRRGFRGDT